MIRAGAQGDLVGKVGLLHAVRDAGSRALTAGGPDTLRDTCPMCGQSLCRTGSRMEICKTTRRISRRR